MERTAGQVSGHHGPAKHHCVQTLIALREERVPVSSVCSIIKKRMVPNKEWRLGKLEKGAGRRRPFSPRAGWWCMDVLILCVVGKTERTLVRITKEKDRGDDCEQALGSAWRMVSPTLLWAHGLLLIAVCLSVDSTTASPSP